MSRLDLECEKQLLKLFPKPVKLGLLYKGSTHGYACNTLSRKFGDEGRCVIIIYLESGAVRGVYLDKALCTITSDKGAFLFEVNKHGGKKFPVLDSSQAAVLKSIKSFFPEKVQFGDSITMKVSDLSYVNFRPICSVYTSTGWDKLNAANCEIELHRVEGKFRAVQDVGHLLPSDWRQLSWSERARDDLMRQVLSFGALSNELPRVRALLLGPAGAGKSSFIVSTRSVMYKRITHLPIVGSAAGGFTRKLTSYDILAKKGGSPTALSLCDTMAVGDEHRAGLSVADALAIIKGHVPEGYKFQAGVPISEKVSGYRASPSLKEKVHCVLFVLDASKVASYSDYQRSTLRELHSEISDLCVPQLILLTHVDQVCHAVHEDVKYVYSSRTLQETVEEAAEVVHMPVSCVLPIKNYVSELAVNCNMDILLLDAICHILHAIDDMLEDQFPEIAQNFFCPGTKVVE